MSNIPSSQAYIQTEAAQFRRPVSENLLQTVGGAVNFLNDLTTSHSASISSNAAAIASEAATRSATDSSLQGQITTEVGNRTSGDSSLQSQLNNKTNITYYNFMPLASFGVVYTATSVGTIDIGAVYGTIPLSGARFAVITVSIHCYQMNALSVQTLDGQTLVGPSAIFTIPTQNGYDLSTMPPFSATTTFVLDSSNALAQVLTFSGTFTNGRITVGGYKMSEFTQQVVVG